MSYFWKVKVRPSIKKEFPDDPMMQELHEFRARYPIRSQKDVLKMHQTLKRNLAKIGFVLKQVAPGQFRLAPQD